MANHPPSFVDRLIAHLVTQYHPLAIILHGSRAKGANTPRSDWDLYLVSHQPIKIKLEVFEDQNLDIDVIQVPLPVDALFAQVGSSLRDATILLDDESKTGAKLLKTIRARYARGKRITNEQLKTKQRYMKRLLVRLEDTNDDAPTFFLHLGHFYNAAYNYWFDVRKEWTRPIYEAFPEIKKRDPFFTIELEVLAGRKTNSEKLMAAKHLYDRLFPETQVNAARR